MKSTLIVKNFGPIKEVELDLRNVNVFIGPQSTGKSALAKIYTIFKAPRKFFYKLCSENKKLTIDNVKALKDFEEVLKEYNIHSFLKPNTEIEFESELHTFRYKNKSMEYTPKLLNTISSLELLAVDFEKNKREIIQGFSVLADNFLFFDIRASSILFEKDENLKLPFTKGFNKIPIMIKVRILYFNFGKFRGQTCYCTPKFLWVVHQKPHCTTS